MIALATTNVLGYLIIGKFKAVILFALVSLISFQFTKNKAIVLLLGLIVTNFAVVNHVVREGMDTNESESTDKLSSINPEMADAITALNTEGTVEKAKAKLSSKSSSVSDLKSPTDVMNPDLNKSTDESAPTGVSQSNTKTSKGTENFNGSKLSGAPVNGSESRIDYASTMETAYDNLYKILGSDSIGKLTNDTQNLMNKQQKLFDTMNVMAPALKDAKEMLAGFDLKSLGDMTNSFK